MTQESADTPDESPKLGRHREMLAVATIVVVFSLLLRTRPDGLVEFAAFPSHPLPQSCITRMAFHLDCPGCGLTRSIIHLAHGDWSAAFRVNRIGPLMAFAILAQFPFRLYGLAKRDAAPLGTLVPKLFGYLLIAGLIGNWVYNQATHQSVPDEVPPLVSAK